MLSVSRLPRVESVNLMGVKGLPRDIGDPSSPLSVPIRPRPRADSVLLGNRQAPGVGKASLRPVLLFHVVQGLPGVEMAPPRRILCGC